MKKVGIITIYTLIFFVIKAPFFAQAETDLQIRHLPLFCVAVGLPVEISFEVLSQTVPQETRVYFREQGTDRFYFTPGTRHGHNVYSAILPAPMATTRAVEYMLLVIDRNKQAVKSALFATPVEEKNMCPHEYRHELPMRVVVSAEQEIEPNIGFEGEHVVWATSPDRLGTPYMENAVEKLVFIGEPATASQEGQGAAEEHQIMSSGKRSGAGKKALIGVGAGAGAALLGVAIAGSRGGRDDKSLWGDVNDLAEEVEASLVKSPALQTACGTTVSNQLFIINNSPEEILLGTIDFEVVLTKDSPAGSCAPGQTGAFAPTGVTTAPSGQTVLIRQWVNETNPCGGCPYISGECVWESRYIVHTSAGSAVALSSFSTAGDLCGYSAKTSQELQNLLQNDLTP